MKRERHHGVEQENDLHGKEETSYYCHYAVLEVSSEACRDHENKNYPDSNVAAKPFVNAFPEKRQKVKMKMANYRKFNL